MEKKMRKTQILNKLLSILTLYLKINVKFGKDFERDRLLFRGLCNQCLSLEGIDDEFYKLQDKLLSYEREEKGVIDVDSFSYKNNISHFNGDITTLKADAIVNAANDEYLGCFIPCHNCIDNVIMSSAGFQMRNELLSLKEDLGYSIQKVKVTRGYNLPCKYVFHVAGPIVYGNVTEKNREDLKNCYIECLNKAEIMRLNSIVFCCLSTGEYHFPNNLACDIAVSTVKKWLEGHNNHLKIVFNTFKQIDMELYNERLSKEN